MARPIRISEPLLLAPALLLLGVALAFPIARVVCLSFMHHTVTPGASSAWVGLDHYVRLWQDGRWWIDLGNTLVFTLASVSIEMILGLAFALALNRRVRGIGLARAAVILPWAMPTAVMALAWAWIFNDAFGVLNDILQRLGILDTAVAWLGQPGTAMSAMVAAEVWKTTPFVALILLAGLQGIPEHVIEAARVDGLSRWQILRRITVPLLMPFIAAALAFRMIQAYSAFDIVYVMTGGGPGGATETVSLYAYQNYFRYLDFGYGSAIATQAVALVALALIVGRWLTRLRGTEGR